MNTQFENRLIKFLFRADHVPGVILFVVISISLKNNYPLWFDEQFTAYWIRNEFTYIIFDGVFEESNPPLFYGALKLWSMVFGTSEAALRALPVACTGFAVVIASKMGSHLGGRHAGIVAGLVFAALPIVNLLGQEARAFALLPLVQGGMVLAASADLKTALNRPPGADITLGFAPGSAALLAVTCVAAIYTHPLSVLFVAITFFVLGVVSLVNARLGLTMIRRYIALGFAVLIVSLVALWALMANSAAGAHDWMEPWTWREASLTIRHLLTGEGAHGWSLPWHLVIMLALLGLACFGAVRSPQVVVALVAGIPLLFVAAVFAFSIHERIAQTRYLFGVTPALAALIAAGILAFARRRALRIVATAAVLGLLVLLTARQGTRGWAGEWHPTTDWRGVTAAIRGEPSCQGPVVSRSRTGVTAWPYYGSEGIGPRILVALSPRDHPESGQLLPFERFLERMTGLTTITPESFIRLLVSGGPMAVVIMGRNPEQSDIMALLRTHAAHHGLVAFSFPPGITLICVRAAG